MNTFRPLPMSCPLCRADVVGTFAWREDEFRLWCKPGRTPICPNCAELLIIGADLRLRVPYPSEVADAHRRWDDIETVQAVILERRRILARRVRDE